MMAAQMVDSWVDAGVDCLVGLLAATLLLRVASIEPETLKRIAYLKSPSPPEQET